MAKNFSFAFSLIPTMSERNIALLFLNISVLGTAELLQHESGRGYVNN